jgi:aminoglycoside phosphotransferase (APT) family kinase protein
LSSERIGVAAETAAALVARQFPAWAGLPVRRVAHSGWDNRTFHLGDDKLIRMPAAPWYRKQVAKEQAWLPNLAPQLPLPIPTPLAKGEPDETYPWEWSIYGWIEGETAAHGEVADQVTFARRLAAFLAALHRADASGAPEAGRHNFFRGGPLSTYDAETRDVVAKLGGKVDATACLALWDAALADRWDHAPVWVHGDFAAGNLLVKDGELCAVIDFGCCAVGDPACDLAIAWTFLEGEAREAFRQALPLDRGTWARGRAWTLWKALITWAGTPEEADASRRIVEDLLADQARG